FTFATIASEIPVLPLVGSSSARPGSSSPEASASRIIASAIRSLIEPVGFAPSSLAYSRTSRFGERRGSSTSGVFPIRSSSEGARRLATGHRRQQDDRRALPDRRLELVERPDVLAVEVHVRVGELTLEPGKAGGEVVEHLADRAPGRRHLSLAADGGAEHRRDPDLRHGCAPASDTPAALATLGPWQNST